MYEGCHCLGLFNAYMTSLSSLIKAFVSDVVILLDDPRGWQNMIKICADKS